MGDFAAARNEHDTESQTPRTDAEKEYLSFELDSNGQCIKLVKADFARQLERDRAELMERLKPFAMFACDEPNECLNCLARATLNRMKGEL